METARLDLTGSDLVGLRVAVTGATGFIGSHLCRQLAAEGAEVVAIDADAGWRPIVPGLVDLGAIRHVDAGPWPYRATRALREAMADRQAIVHLAHRPSVGANRLSQTRDAVETDLLGLLELLSTVGPDLQCLCIASSAMVYDGDGLGARREDDPTRPRSSYGVAKLAAEQAARVALGPDVTVSVLRLATVYGPFETVPRAIPNFIRRALGHEPLEVRGPADERDYVHVDDVVEAMVTTLRAGRRAEGVFNVGTGVATRTDDLAALVVALVGVAVPLLRLDTARPPIRLVLDPTHTATTLGVRPSIPLVDGVRDEIAWIGGLMVAAALEGQLS